MAGKKRRKISDRLDITCDYCNKLMKPGGVVTRSVGGREYQFCSEKCRNEFIRHKMWKTEKSVLERYMESRKDAKSRDVLVIGAIVLIILIVAVAIAIYIMTLPGPTVYAKLKILDVTPLKPTSAGDGENIKVPIRIEMENEGLGESGHIEVRLSAINVTSSFEVDSFTTSRLERLDNHKIVDKIPKGVTVVVYGNLTVPPGKYRIKVSIYEDGSRELVSGNLVIKVDIETVKTEEGYEGRSAPGKERAGASQAPGMEGIAAVAALVLAYVWLERKKRLP